MSENAYSFTQSVPAELVSTDNQAIVDLIKRDHDVGVGADLMDEWDAAQKNTYTTFPVVRVDAPSNPGDIFDGSITTYETIASGDVYQIERQFVAPSLDAVKNAAFSEADNKSDAFLNGGFFFDSDLYDSDPPTRSLYAEVGVQAANVGGAFMIDIRDAGSTNHALNNTQWLEAYTEFFNHIVQAKDEFDAVRLEIILAPDEAAVQAALDAMSPPNNTL